MADIPPANRPDLLAPALAAAAALAYLASELYLLSGGLGFPLDDSWIHLRFAHQLAAGEGLAYNSGGPWVPGTTAPLWTALLAPGFLLGRVAAVVWAKLLGCVFFVATVDASGRLAAALGVGPGLRRLAGVLVAASHWLVWSALSGLEIGLFSCLGLWGIVLHLRERGHAEARPTLSLAVFALAALARPEGYLLLLLALADRLLLPAAGPPPARAVLRGLLPAAVILLPTLVFYRLTGGSFLPTTFAVKAGTAGVLPDGAYLRAVLDVVFRSQPVMLLLAGAGVLRLVARAAGSRSARARSLGLLPALWPVGLALAYSLLQAPGGPVMVGNFGRYFFPVLPLVVVLGVLGLEPTARRLRACPAVLRWALVALVLAPQALGLYRGPLRYLQTVANVEDSDVRAARWLAPRLPPEAVLAVQDIGALKHLLPNPVVDLAGIVSPDVLSYLRGTDPPYWEDRLLRYLEGERPDYLVVFPASYPKLATATPGFDRVRSFPVPRNVTMAGDEIAVFSTPWTRHPLRE